MGEFVMKLTKSMKDILFEQHMSAMAFVDEQGEPEILLRVVELWDEETFIMPESRQKVLKAIEKNPYVCICVSSARHEKAQYKFEGKAEVHQFDQVFMNYRELQKKPSHPVSRLLAAVTVSCENAFFNVKNEGWVPLGREHYENCYKCAKERGQQMKGETACILCGGVICRFHRFKDAPVCISCARQYGLRDGWKIEAQRRSDLIKNYFP
jgi:hypothetical protein